MGQLPSSFSDVLPGRSSGRLFGAYRKGSPMGESHCHLFIFLPGMPIISPGVSSSALPAKEFSLRHHTPWQAQQY